MNMRPYLLGAVALALAVAVGWDYWPAPQVVASGPDADTAQLAAKAPAVVTLNPLSQRGAADFAALFDHPLFDPRRTKAELTPLPVPDQAPLAAVVSPDPVVTPMPAQPVLMGTVTSPWPGGVYLGDDQGGPVVFLRPGQAAQGLHLEEARPDSALFMGPEGEVTLTLKQADPAALGDPVSPDAAMPDAVDPNATDMGAMAPGAVDPTLTVPDGAGPAP